MSHAVRVKVSASVRERVRSHQASQRTITLDLDVLPRERLREMLLAELRRRGFDTEPDGTLARRRGDATERVDPQTLVATSEIEEEALVDKREETFVESRRQEVVRAARERLEARLLEEARLRLERDLSARVDAAGAALERDLHEALAAVYAEAIREKARTLGEVVGVRESRDGSEVLLEIQVKVSDE